LNPDRIRKIQPELVSVTPSPILLWLEGLHDRVVGRVEMPGGMFILRLVAAADVPAFKTDAQVYPGVADFQAILAPIRAWCNLTYLVKMTTLFCHCARFPFSLSSMTSRVMTRMAGSPNTFARLLLGIPTLPIAFENFGQHLSIPQVRSARLRQDQIMGQVTSGP
jgi:hypothetical protein